MSPDQRLCFDRWVASHLTTPGSSHCWLQHRDHHSFGLALFGDQDGYVASVAVDPQAQDDRGIIAPNAIAPWAREEWTHVEVEHLPPVLLEHIAYALSRVMEEHLEHRIDPYQASFERGRYISASIQAPLCQRDCHAVRRTS